MTTRNRKSLLLNETAAPALGWTANLPEAGDVFGVWRDEERKTLERLAALRAEMDAATRLLREIRNTAEKEAERLWSDDEVSAAKRVTA